MKVFLVILASVILQPTMGNCQTQLQGKVTELSSGEPVIFGSVALFQAGVLIAGTETDFDGNYLFSNLQSGSYALEIKYLGLKTKIFSNVFVLYNKVTALNILLEEDLEVGGCYFITCGGPSPPLVELDNLTQGHIYYPNEKVNGKTYVLFERGRSSVRGKVIDEESGDTMIGVDVKISQKGKIISEHRSDISGNFSIANLVRRRYELEFSLAGYESQSKIIKLKRGDVFYFDVFLKTKDTFGSPIIIIDF